MNLSNELIFPVIQPSHVLWEKGEALHEFQNYVSKVAATRGCGGTGEEVTINPAEVGAGEERGFWGQTASAWTLALLITYSQGLWMVNYNFFPEFPSARIGPSLYLL